TSSVSPSLGTMTSAPRSPEASQNVDVAVGALDSIAPRRPTVMLVPRSSAHFTSVETASVIWVGVRQPTARDEATNATTPAATAPRRRRRAFIFPAYHGHAQ